MSACVIHVGDALEVLRGMAGESVHCVVTSPPYYGLRDYGVAGQIGLEESPGEFIGKLVEVFREVRRVLRRDGTCWVNMGDSYASSGGHSDSSCNDRRGAYNIGRRPEHEKRRHRNDAGGKLKAKDLMGMPWRLAFALQNDGWWLRRDIVWHKPNAMPESVTDRPSCAHEYLFLLTRSPRYHYDAAAIREPASAAMIKQVLEGYRGESTKLFAEGMAQDASGTKKRIIEGARKKLEKQRGHSRRHAGFNDRWDQMTREEQLALGSNKRSVWSVPTAACKEAHFAAFPPALIKPCVLAGCPVGGVVLDPFGGTGTTGVVALELGRAAVLCELNPEYAAMAERRLAQVTPGLGLA